MEVPPSGTHRRDVALRQLLLRVQGEYREMPGLSVTASQAERLWGLDSTTCAVVLATLIERGFLRQTPSGSYRRRASA